MTLWVTVILKLIGKISSMGIKNTDEFFPYKDTDMTTFGESFIQVEGYQKEE